MGWIWLLTLAGAEARADDCAQRIAARDFRARMTALTPYVATGDPDQVRGSLEALEVLALGCVDGPLFAADMGGLYLAQAAVELLHQGGVDRAAERLRWAAALNTPQASAEAYGADVRLAYQTELQTLPGDATLEIWLTPQPSVMVIDGLVEYELGARSLPIGAHLVQWLGPDGWTAERVILTEGATATVGTPPEPEPEPEPEPQEARRRERITSAKPVREPREGAVREVRPRQLGEIGAEMDRAWSLEVGAGGAWYNAQVSDGAALWEGAALTPSGRLSLERALGDVLYLSAAGAGTLPADGARPNALTRGALSFGAHLGDGAQITIGAGGAVAPVPTPAEGALDFSGELALGPRGELGLAVGSDWRLGLEASGAWLMPALDLGGALTASRASVPGGRLSPVLALRGGQLTAPGLAEQTDRYRWAGLELGAALSL